ncbi:GID complex subunit containing RING finger motif [Malassezia brasiliensis]|uniref:GID complex subunit containing RING finger motif n=1 Tax=Malassezia brasiliensis TaxID=1821822 RepID=A0AAF0IR75_9BASI|nr:GID complex subunit containing RING finger motif [Malassezia brasiliensis]
MPETTGARPPRPDDLAHTSKHVSMSGMSSIEDMLIIEQPLLRVPVDEMRMQLKTQQRLWERDYAYCTGVLQAHADGAHAEQVPHDTERVQDALQRLRTLRDRLAELQRRAQHLLQDTQARAEYLGAVYSLDLASHAFEEWCLVRLNRMVIDYMLRRGAFASAEALAAQQRLAPLVDLPVFAQIRKVEVSLVPDDGAGDAPSCATALAWCSENKVALRKAQSTLELELRVQEYVEMVRDRTPASLRAAARYARKYLVPWLGAAPAPGDDAREGPPAAARTLVSRAMGLLAVPPGSWPYRDLYDPQRWRRLRDAFRAIALQVYDLPPTPLLHVALSAGLSALKTHACGSAPGKDVAMVPTGGLPSAGSSLFLADSLEPDCPSQTDDRHPDCPVCYTRQLGTLAREVPFSHQGQSRLVCRITGRQMNDTNPPLCLPNGRVYSEAALQQLAADSADRSTVTCPRTGARFPLAACRKLKSPPRA